MEYFKTQINRNSRAGQTLILFAMLFVVLAGVLGLVFDGARLSFERQRAQTAADAAAIGGVQELRRGNNDNQTQVTPAAEYDAGLHGFEASDVTVHFPPVNGEHANDSNYVEVFVAKQVPTTFMRIFGPRTSTVRARSVAGLKATGDPCILVLDPDDADSYKHNGTPILTADCGIMVNSRDSSRALRQNGSGSITATWVGVTGGASGSNITPTPQTGVPPMVDPLASLDPPSLGSVPNGYTTSAATTSAFGGTSFAARGGNGNGNGNGGGGGDTTHYWPGVYDSEIKIQNGDVVFEPGMYILEKGMKISGGTVRGSEVFFYSVNADGKQHIDIGGNASVQLSAPTSGDYKGMLFFVNRDAPDRSPGNKIARGTEDSFFSGAIYMPSQHLDFAGNPETAIHWTVVVVNTLNISGTAGVQVVAKPTTEQAPPAYRTVLWE